MDKKLKIILFGIVAIIIYTVCVVTITLGVYKNKQKKNIDKLVNNVTHLIEDKTNNIVQEKEDTTDYNEFKENMKNMLDNIKNKSNN